MLIKSKSKTAFKKNIAKEITSGKPVKQAVAISYSVKKSVPKEGSKKEQKWDKGKEMKVEKKEYKKTPAKKK